MLYGQTDYPQLYLGTSGLTAAEDGCFAFDIINALNLSGYPVTPDQFFAAINAVGGFDGVKSNGVSQGLLEWSAVSACYPQVSIGQNAGNYILTKAYNAKNGTYHWWLQSELTGNVYDPYTKSSDHPSGYKVVSGLSLEINPAPPQVITTVAVVQHFDQFLINLAPAQVERPEALRVQQYLAAKGFYAASQDGYYGPKTQAAVHAFQEAHGITKATEYGWWFDQTRSAANADLSYSSSSNQA